MTKPEEKTAPERQPPETAQSGDAFELALLQYPPAERDGWRAEALRLAQIVSDYAQLKPKRRWNTKSGSYEFTSEVRRLCERARCRRPGAAAARAASRPQRLAAQA